MCMRWHVLAICWDTASWIPGIVNKRHVVAVVVACHPDLAAELPVANDALVWPWTLDACWSLRMSRSCHRWKRAQKRLAGPSNKYISSLAFSLSSDIVGQTQAIFVTALTRILPWGQSIDREERLWMTYRVSERFTGAIMQVSMGEFAARLRSV